MRCTLKESSILNMVFTQLIRLCLSGILFVFWIGFILRSSRQEMLLVEGVLKICSKFTGEHPYRRVTPLNLLCNFIELTLWYGCSPVNLLYIFRATFTKNTSEWLLLHSLNAEVYFGPCQKLLLGLHHRCL